MKSGDSTIFNHIADCGVTVRAESTMERLIDRDLILQQAALGAGRCNTRYGPG